MSTNKKFRIQNGADIVGELSINDVTVIGADGKVVEGAVADAVASLTAADIADLQSQVSAIIGTSPEHLDTLQEIVAAFEGADTNLVTSVATNTSDIATINTTLTNGVATPTDVADLQSQVTSNDTDIAANAAAIAAANSRTSGISTSSGSSNIQMTAEVDMDSNKVTNMADPTAAQDAATKAYVDAASTGSSSSLATETAARIAGDSANEADATAKADAAEASAKAYADQVVAATVDAAPAALDTLNELAAALGDDANFSATVTNSLATKADDAATTAALATKADDAATTAALATKATVVDVDALEAKVGTVDVELLPSTISSTDRDNYYSSVISTTIGQQYTVTFTVDSIDNGGWGLVAWNPGGNVNTKDVLDYNFSSTSTGVESRSFTATSESVTIAFRPEVPNANLQLSSVSMPSPAPTLDTSAQVVVPAINELHTELNALSSTQSGDQSNLQSQITAEVARASSAEAVNAANIVSETSARSSADAALQSDIVGLQNQVGTIISGSPASLDTLVEIVSAFETADASLSGVITANGGRLTTAENNITALGADITAEESARGSADATLQAAIDAEALTRSNLGSQLLGYININGGAITAGDNANSAEVATEKSRAEGAEATLQSNIDALTSSTGGDVSGLQSSIDAEEAARIAADSALQSSIDAEESRATSAEAGLQSQISNVLSNTDATALNSLAEIVAEFQSADSTLTGAVAGHGTRLTSLESSTSAILAWDTDNLSEGTTNKFWTPERSKSALTGGLCITYNSSTGEIKIDEAETASSLHVASSSDANELGGQAPSHYRINVYDVNGTIVN